MNLKQIVLGFVLFDFLALNAWAIYEYGYVGFFQQELSTLAGIAVLVDLVIALSLALGWMYRDARERGAAFLPYAVLTLFLGSAGPLLYLLRRESARSPAGARGLAGAAEGA